MRTRSSLALLIALTTACIEPQMHGHRADGGADGGGALDTDGGALIDDGGGPIDTDSGLIDTDDGGSIVPDGGGGLIVAPPFLHIALTASERIEVTGLGAEVRTTHFVSVVSMSALDSYTPSPSTTIGGCDLFPPVGTGTWPPGTYVEATPAPLPLEYVAITADGVPLEYVAITADGVPLETTLVEPVPTLTAPEVRPSVDRRMRGTIAAGTDLTIAWAATDRPDARQVVDILGGVGAARCERLHGEGSLTQTAADIRDRLLGREQSWLSVNVHTSIYEDETVGTTMVRRYRSWTAPPAELDVMR